VTGKLIMARADNAIKIRRVNPWVENLNGKSLTLAEPFDGCRNQRATAAGTQQKVWQRARESLADRTPHGQVTGHAQMWGKQLPRLAKIDPEYFCLKTHVMSQGKALVLIASGAIGGNPAGLVL
jgi:hypothetical protein